MMWKMPGHGKYGKPLAGGGLPYLPHPLENLLWRGSSFPTFTTSLILGFFPGGTGKKDGSYDMYRKN